jgi:hypothetical protein
MGELTSVETFPRFVWRMAAAPLLFEPGIALR